MADINGDGIKDLIFGHYMMNVFYCLRKQDGTLEEVKKIQANGSDLKMPDNFTSVVATDWNEDGLLDLLVSTAFRGIYIFINSGTKTEYKFTTSTQVQTGMTTNMNNGTFNRPTLNVVDFNKDGKKDIISGSGYPAKPAYVYFFENIGTNAEPKFEKGIKLKYEDGTDISNATDDIHVGLGDWNNDGTIDLLWSGGSSSQKYIHVAVNTNMTAIAFSQPQKNISTINLNAKNNFHYNFSMPVKARKNVRYSLFNSCGKEIARERIGNSTTDNFSISFEKVPSGVYYILFNADDNYCEWLQLLHTSR